MTAALELTPKRRAALSKKTLAALKMGHSAILAAATPKMKAKDRSALIDIANYFECEAVTGVFNDLEMEDWKDSADECIKATLKTVHRIIVEGDQT